MHLVVNQQIKIDISLFSNCSSETIVHNKILHVHMYVSVRDVILLKMYKTLQSK